MKDFWGWVAALAAVSVVIIMIVLSCGKPPGPGPDPLTDYTVKGPVSQIEGRLKPGVKASLEETKRFMQTAVDVID